MTEVVAEPTVASEVTDRVTDSVAIGVENGTHAEDRGSEDDDEDEEEDDDEAEEIARRLKEQLWADISKAQASQVIPSTQPITVRTEAAVSGPTTALSRKRDAAFQTMKGILAITENDTLARSMLASAVVPGTNDDNVLSVLNQVVRANSISKALAKSLAPVLVSLARSDTLFATMRHSNAASIQLDKGKRKRDESDEEQRQSDVRAAKRPNIIVHHDFQRQITDAVKAVSGALTASSPTDGALDASIISSIQHHLHQLFLFSMTSSAGGGPEIHALQEIGGLIQVLGVLSGIQIGPTTTPNHPASAPALHPWMPPGTHPESAPFNDIGTAVYPCLMPGCRKTFARLYNLRAHQRLHAVHRPFRCIACPASFARNHDLKRHAKVHEKKAWQCAGCDKMFSRRDAIKRHKNSSAARGGKGEACVGAAVREVALDKDADEDAVREGRRTRMWADIVGGGGGGVGSTSCYGHEGQMEEGEVHADVIRQMQGAVLSLHATLQGHVSGALGTDHAAPPLHLDPTGGQATLASVIARAQMQNMTQQPHVIRDVGSAGSASVLPKGPSLASPNDERATSLDRVRSVDDGGLQGGVVPSPQLSLYGLSDEQTKLLEQAIANAASAAQAQAEAEAALEEEDEEEDDAEEEDPHDADGINDALSSAGAQPSTVPGG